MDDDEELRSQCFGGDYPAQSFDQPVMKRYLFLNNFLSKIRSIYFVCRQRRWWNAYILFYEQISNDGSNSDNNLEKDLAELQLCR